MAATVHQGAQRSSSPSFHSPTPSKPSLSPSRDGFSLENGVAVSTRRRARFKGRSEGQAVLGVDGHYIGKTLSRVVDNRSSFVLIRHLLHKVLCNTRSP